ncbi:MAG TPA: GSCFA domain-containing protein, partial [Flavobacterium sp.]
VVSLGSCFAVNIAVKFEYFKFQITANPVGILFHPLALEKAMLFATEGRKFNDSNIIFHNERWHCLDAHSELSHPEKEVLIERLNSAAELTRTQLKDCSHLIITLGTAWVYNEISSGEIVANCHKLPQNLFKKELLSVNAILQSLKNIIHIAKELNGNVVILFTISPVRHIKDGFVENQWSKSNLISALHSTLSQHPEVSYFPSYEIVMDELRDYRFYADDMLHPNSVAIDYIWKRFSETWISETVSPTLKEVDSIQKALAHKPFNSESVKHRQFVNDIEVRISVLQKEYPHISF